MNHNVQKRKTRLRQKRKLRIRGKINGTHAVPRISVFRSNKHIYAQVIDDVAAVTLVAADGKKLAVKPNKEGAKALAQNLAESMKAKGIERAIFDRNGYLYHGVIAEFAQALRDSGIRI